MAVNFDHNRREVTGIPEVVLAEPKTVHDLEDSINAGLKNADRILITRINEKQVEVIKKLAEKREQSILFDRYQRTAIIGNLIETGTKPRVAILSGGTSDQPIVEEIKLSLEFYGISAKEFTDIGVAGIHRHKDALSEIETLKTVKVLIVVAGNEGALFTVISAQTSLPVIAVPVSVGYGFGGGGLTALQSALQSCSPGVVTVNIDNGFGAASFVKKMLIQ